jgi:hypothetical protein
VVPLDELLEVEGVPEAAVRFAVSAQNTTLSLSLGHAFIEGWPRGWIAIR